MASCNSMFRSQKSGNSKASELALNIQKLRHAMDPRRSCSAVLHGPASLQPWFWAHNGHTPHSLSHHSAGKRCRNTLAWVQDSCVLRSPMVFCIFFNHPYKFLFREKYNGLITKAKVWIFPYRHSSGCGYQNSVALGCIVLACLVRKVVVWISDLSFIKKKIEPLVLGLGQFP